MRQQRHSRAPFHWAGYVIIGEGTQPVAITPRSRDLALLPPMVAGLLLVVGIIMVIQRRRRPAQRSIT